MDQVITFNKTMDDRLWDYDRVLSGKGPFPPLRIHSEWSHYLQLSLDPSGWQAVWKMHRRTCEQFNIPFPTLVLVVVLNVDFHEHTAMVKILAVQDDDIHLPAKHCVALKHLWPTKQQDPSIAVNNEQNAEVLDMLRFFYERLFMPWDNDMPEDADWKNEHLESRIQLHYSIMNGSVPEVLAKHFQGLLGEAKALASKLEKLEDGLDELDEVKDQPVVKQVAEYQMRMLEIKSEVEIMEVPIFREVMLDRLKSEETVISKTEKIVWLIYDQGNASQYSDILKVVEKDYAMQECKFALNLQTALDEGHAENVFILKEGTQHSISSTGALEMGGVMKGLVREKTFLVCKIEHIMLNIQGDVVLENITIDASLPQYAIVVRRGKLTMKNCSLNGDGQSSIHTGIIVLSGATLELIDSEVSKFNTAIVGNSGASINILNSTIHSCKNGLKIYNVCSVKAFDSKIGDCVQYGICLEYEVSDEKDQQVGSFETLNIVPKIEIKQTVGDNNGKGDAVINRRGPLKPIMDLFQNPDTDPTLSEEKIEMDCDSSIVDCQSAVTV